MQKLMTRLPFYEKKWFQFILFTIMRFENDRCRDKAASLTYTTLFAVVPMLTVFLVIISSIKALEPARQQVQHLIYSNFLPRSSIAFDQAFNSFAEKSSNLTAIGILFLFMTSLMMLTSVKKLLTAFGESNSNVVASLVLCATGQLFHLGQFCLAVLL